MCKKIPPQNDKHAVNPAVVHNMFAIWRAEFPRSTEKLNAYTAMALKEAFGSSFGGSLQAWKYYLRTVKTSWYITTKPYLLTLEWLLRRKTIENINNGQYGVARWRVIQDGSTVGHKAEIIDFQELRRKYSGV
jgi:hypothetical protein